MGASSSGAPVADRRRSRARVELTRKYADRTIARMITCAETTRIATNRVGSERAVGIVPTGHGFVVVYQRGGRAAYRLIYGGELWTMCDADAPATECGIIAVAGWFARWVHLRSNGAKKLGMVSP